MTITISKTTTPSTIQSGQSVQIPGYGRYCITSWGLVYDTVQKQFIVAYHNGSSTGASYMKLTLCDNYGKSRGVLLHRLLALAFIPNPHALPYVDHINRNSLDNRTRNLRWVTPAQNSQNQKPRKHSSRYRGVSWDRGTRKWRATIAVKGKAKYLGIFADEQDAALAYDRVALDMGFRHHNGLIKPL